MQGEGQAVELPSTLEEDAAGDAAFASGFDATRADNAPAGGTVLEVGEDGKPLVTDPKGDGNTEEDPAAIAAAAEAARMKAEADAAAAAQAEANAPAIVTKAQLEQLAAAAALVPQLQEELKRSRDTTAGKIGSLKQTLDAVQAQAAKGQAPTIKQMKRLEAEFPELAKLFTEDLNDAFGSAAAGAAEPGTQPPGDNGQPAAPVVPVDPLSDPAVQTVLRNKNLAVVDALHPGWRGTQGQDGTYVPGLKDSPEFQEWRAGLPPAAQHMLANTWESSVIDDALKDFKGWQQKRIEQVQASAAQAEANKQRDKRLEHGVPATTGRATGANAVDEDTAFLSGYKEVRG